MEAHQVDAALMSTYGDGMVGMRTSILVAPITSPKSGHRRYRSPAAVTRDVSGALVRGASRTAGRLGKFSLCCMSHSAIRTRSPEQVPAEQESDAASTSEGTCSTDSDDYSSITSQEYSWQKPVVTNAEDSFSSDSDDDSSIASDELRDVAGSPDSWQKPEISGSVAPLCVSIGTSTGDDLTASPRSTSPVPASASSQVSPSVPQSYPTVLPGAHPIAVSSLAPTTSDDQAKSDCEPSRSGPKGKGKGKGKGPVMLPPMPQGCQMPDWRGPKAPLSMQGDRATNLKPNRNHALFQGSIYQQIYEENSFPHLPEAWLRTISGSHKLSIPPVPAAARRSQKDSPILLIEPGKAKNIGMLHAGLQRKGVNHANVLIGSSDGKKLSADVLESLRDMLNYVSAEEEERMHNTGLDVELVPAEAFLRDLLDTGGTFKAIKDRISLLLRMERFADEAEHLETLIRKGVSACNIRASSEMLMLLKGVLVTGNYVNAASSRKGIDNFVAVSLDSVAKLAETRYQNPAGSGRSNALTGLVKQLEEQNPGFTTRLREDLQRCKDLDPKDARGIDPKELQEGILNGKGAQDTEGSLQDLSELVARLHAVEQSHSDDMLGALQPAQIQEFLAIAEPRVQRLQEQLAHFSDEVVAMRRFFAEPPSSTFKEMLRSVSALRDAIP